MKTRCNSALKLRATLWLLFSCWSCYAQAQNQYALIVGISEYKEVAPLQFADRDALAFADFLKTQQVPEDNINLFLNENATRVNIVDELYSLTQTLKPHDRFYFYFGGHGDLEAKISHENSLLLLYNSFKTGYFKGNEFLQLSELKTWFDALTKKQVEVIFIADACHSGGLIGGKEGISKTQKALQERWGSVTKILSCQANEFSLEGKQWGGGRGLFSYHLVNGLTGRADANKDRNVSLVELNSYLTTNVLREANPNVQTPVVLGNTGQFLSTVSEAGLAQLADYEKRNFPIISEVNLKGGEGKLYELLLSKLDTSLVNIYKQFSKALKEKRVAQHDDSTDYALLHYKKLTARKIPANLVQLMKRSLTVGLLERELEVMKGVRERGQGGIVRTEKVLMPAITNLETTMSLLGSGHYFYTYLKGRKLILESQMPTKELVNARTIDQNLKTLKDNQRQQKEILLRGLQLEPNMISTYVLLSTSYRINQQPDSAIYFQEKVVDLLPNQAYAYLNLGISYSRKKFTDAANRPAPHPKAIEHLEKTIELAPAMQGPYSLLGNLYMGTENLDRQDSVGTYYRDYAKAIPYYEKLLGFHEIPEQKLTDIGSAKNSREMYGPHQHYNGFEALIYDYSVLNFLYNATGNSTKSNEYLTKTKQKTAAINSVHAYTNASAEMYQLFTWEQKEVYLSYALDFLQQAMKKADENMEVVSVDDKSFLALQHREVLKAMGTVHRALKNYTEAEKFIQQALVYPVPDSPFKSRLKLTDSYVAYHENRILPIPYGMRKTSNGDYHYRLDPYFEMFLLKLDQTKPDEAFVWLEKAFQNSVVEQGNDISGKPFEEAVLDTYKNLDKARFLALKAKYFPPAEKK